MDAFPAFIPLTNGRVVVVGHGPAADAKARLFIGSPAQVVRLAPDRALAADVYLGARLVFIALEDAGVAAQAAALARAAGALVNAVDRPELGDFLSPAVIDRGPVIGAVSTTGASPVLATRLRAEIEGLWPEGLGRVAELSRRLQSEIRARFPDFTDRRAALHALLDGPAARAALDGDDQGAERLAREGFDVAGRPVGRIVFVEAPDHPDRLSLAAARVLARAEVLTAAPDVPQSVLGLVRREAEHYPQATPADWLGWADEGKLVVRLSLLDAAEITAAGGRAEVLRAAI